MKFYIEITNHAEDRLITYIAEEHSFDIDPIVNKVNFDLVINYLNLTVNGNNRVIQIWGYCPKNWIKADFNPPEALKGDLKIEDDLEPGFSYRITEPEEWTVYENPLTGWVCLGDPIKKGNSVEFINNCIAVIDDMGNFISLWLKPEII